MKILKIYHVHICVEPNAQNLYPNCIAPLPTTFKITGVHLEDTTATQVCWVAALCNNRVLKVVVC